MSEKVLRLTDENWSEHVLSAPGTVLVDFWASWCPPCRLLAPEIEALAGSVPGYVAVGKLDVDASSATAARYGVRSIPTLVLFEGGREVGRRLGFASAQELKRWLEQRQAPAADGAR